MAELGPEPESDPLPELDSYSALLLDLFCEIAPRLWACGMGAPHVPRNELRDELEARGFVWGECEFLLKKWAAMERAFASAQEKLRASETETS